MISIQFNTNGEQSMMNNNLLSGKIKQNLSNMHITIMLVHNGRTNMIAWKSNIEVYKDKLKIINKNLKE